MRDHEADHAHPHEGCHPLLEGVARGLPAIDAHPADLQGMKEKRNKGEEKEEKEEKEYISILKQKSKERK